MDCFENGIINTHSDKQRQPQRKLNGINEKEVEKQFVEAVKKTGFNDETSLPYLWLARTLKLKNIKLYTSNSIIRFIGYALEETIPREVYRRRPCIYYWMCERIERIAQYFKQNQVEIVFNDNRIHLSTQFLEESLDTIRKNEFSPRANKIPLPQIQFPFNPIQDEAIVNDNDFCLFDQFYTDMQYETIPTELENDIFIE